MQTLIGFGHLGNAPHDDDNDDTIEILDESRVYANNDIENGGDSADDDGANEDDDDEEGQEGDSPLTGDWCCHVRSVLLLSLLPVLLLQIMLQPMLLVLPLGNY